MSYFIGVTEDQKVLRDAIIAKVKTIPATCIRGDALPWRLLRAIEGLSHDEWDEGGVIVADLYVRGYWAESPNPPKFLPRRPTHSSGEDPKNLTDAVIDCIGNYLAPIVEKFQFDILIYSHMFNFLEKNEEWKSYLQQIVAALGNIGVTEGKIIQKKLKDDWEHKEIDVILSKVSDLVNAKRAIKG